jgi:hypothetical protein
MTFHPHPRLSPVQSCALVAGLMLAVAGCSQVTPLGPDPAATMPQPHQLRTPFVLQAMQPKPFLPAGGCPAGYAKVAVSNGACFAKTGTPVTITSAAVSPVFSPPTTSPAGQPPPPAQYGFTITLSPAEVPELTAVTTTAADDQGPLALSVDGRTWVLPLVAQPFTGRQFMVPMTSKNQAVQLRRLLAPSG